MESLIFSTVLHVTWTTLTFKTMFTVNSYNQTLTGKNITVFKVGTNLKHITCYNILTIYTLEHWIDALT